MEQVNLDLVVRLDPPVRQVTQAKHLRDLAILFLGELLEMQGLLEMRGLEAAAVTEVVMDCQLQHPTPPTTHKGAQEVTAAVPEHRVFGQLLDLDLAPPDHKE